MNYGPLFRAPLLDVSPGSELVSFSTSLLGDVKVCRYLHLRRSASVLVPISLYTLSHMQIIYLYIYTFVCIYIHRQIDMRKDLHFYTCGYIFIYLFYTYAQIQRAMDIPMHGCAHTKTWVTCQIHRQNHTCGDAYMEYICGIHQILDISL